MALKVFDIHNFGKARRPIASPSFKSLTVLTTGQYAVRGWTFSSVPLYFYYIISLLEGNLTYYLYFGLFFIVGAHVGMSQTDDVPCVLNGVRW